LQWALLCFTAAAFLAILTNVPVPYREASVADLRSVLGDEDSVADATREVALNRLDILVRAKSMNRCKAWVLNAALAAEAAAVGFLAWSMFEIV
jgi:hypothetical protein